MVKIPKDKRKGAKVLFRDALGRFVSQSRRYQDAVSMQRQFRGKYEEVWRGNEKPEERVSRQKGKPKKKRKKKAKAKRLTPKIIADLLPRDEFESLAPNYGDEKMIVPKDKQFTAWDLANQMNRVRGLRGHMVKVVMVIQDGTQTKRIQFYRKAKRKGDMAYGFFRQANTAIGNEGGFLYNRIGSKLLPDRVGRKVHLIGWEVSKEL